MTLAQEVHQKIRYGIRDFNNHKNSRVGTNSENIAPIYKQQDYINDAPNVIPKRMNNTEKMKELNKIKQRRKEASPIIADNPFN